MQLRSYLWYPFDRRNKCVIQHPKGGTGEAVPLYADCVVGVEMKGAEGSPQIIIELKRDRGTGFVLLNGIEEFKVSNASQNLTGANPELSSPKTSQQHGVGIAKKARKKGIWVIPDVYSFGVVLFEVLCARKALDMKLPEDQMNLAHWAKKCIANRTIYQVIDPNLIGKITPERFKVFVEIAESCIQDKGVNRPSMNDVMEKLGFALELQEAADAEKEKINPNGDHSYPEIVFSMAREINVDNDSGLCSSICSEISSLNISSIGLTCPSLDP